MSWKKPLHIPIANICFYLINQKMYNKIVCISFEVMATIYQQIGYNRKAAFFQRLAALKHVHQSSSNPDWSQTYRLMLSGFSGYMLSLDPLEVLDTKSGWPSLQIDLLQSLITAAKRLCLSTLATRHITFLLQTQWHNMTPTEQSEMAVQLQNLSAQCEGSPVPLVLENGTIIPPANLTDLPFCLDIVVKDLPALFKPQRIKIAEAETGPFLFTPLQFKTTSANFSNFTWNSNRSGSVGNSRLQYPHLGCKIELSNETHEKNFLVDVIPALPTITVKTSLPQTATFSSMMGSESVLTTASLTLYNGESSTWGITITNKSDIPIEHLEINITSNIEQEMQKKIFQINGDMQSKLPIAAKCSTDFVVDIFAEADFIWPIVNHHNVSSAHSTSIYPYDHSNTLQYSSNLSTVGHAGLPSYGPLKFVWTIWNISSILW